jgi:hypothetical protein
MRRRSEPNVFSLVLYGRRKRRWRKRRNKYGGEGPVVTKEEEQQKDGRVLEETATC